MLQSIAMKEYPQEVFSDFGLTVVDECHHISAEVFSRSLFKVVTKYMLGLSANYEQNFIASDGDKDVFTMRSI